MPLIDQVPPAPTVVVLAVVLWPPLLATTEIVVPTSPVPLMLVLVFVGIIDWAGDGGHTDGGRNRVFKLLFLLKSPCFLRRRSRLLYK